jgi:hypothetical protein
MDQKQREKFDSAMQSVDGEWIKLKVRGVLRDRERASAVESISSVKPVESHGEDTPTRQRERRLPPRPSWYGSRDQATLSTLAAKQTLTSRSGANQNRR